ncbi:hypothetical protein HDA45_000590 [Amycolatopsis umgeniensis]|uniref:Uncharacterized protein n=1 Tax=Amycolatopsis umgeniensis TaxID=336628 RepID=A0A841AU80_9PSEU|nr:hypothetical protein [Amycolatopsis umgeniensis]
MFVFPGQPATPALSRPWWPEPVTARYPARRKCLPVE